MSYTFEEFERTYLARHYAKMTTEQRRVALEGLSPEERQQLLEGLPPAERLAGLPPEERLAGLSDEQIRQVLEQRAAGHPAQPRKPRRKK